MFGLPARSVGRSLLHDYSAQFGNWNCLKELITVYNIDHMRIGADDDDFGRKANDI